jgi:hypothetical protein
MTRRLWTGNRYLDNSSRTKRLSPLALHRRDTTPEQQHMTAPRSRRWTSLDARRATNVTRRPTGDHRHAACANWRAMYTKVSCCSGPHPRPGSVLEQWQIVPPVLEQNAKKQIVLGRPSSILARKMVPISARHAHVPGPLVATRTCCSDACHHGKGPECAGRARVWSELG